MTSIRFFTDEDIYGTVAPALRRAGVDALSTPEAGRLCESDESQLSWATLENRVLVTFNVGDFTALHIEWIKSGRSHAGIVCSSQRPLRDVLRRLLNLADKLDAKAMRNRLEFLGDW